MIIHAAFRLSRHIYSCYLISFVRQLYHLFGTTVKDTAALFFFLKSPNSTIRIWEHCAAAITIFFVVCVCICVTTNHNYTCINFEKILDVCGFFFSEAQYCISSGYLVLSKFLTAWHCANILSKISWHKGSNELKEDWTKVRVLRAVIIASRKNVSRLHP